MREQCGSAIYLKLEDIIYIKYISILGFGIAVFDQEREQSRFRGSMREHGGAIEASGAKKQNGNANALAFFWFICTSSPSSYYLDNSMSKHQNTLNAVKSRRLLSISCILKG